MSFVTAGTAWAQSGTASGLVAIPPLNARVTDLTGTLSAADQAALEAKLAAFEAEAGPQIVVLMLAATAPEDISAYTQRLGEAWKLGRRDVGDGLLLVVAKDERKIRIAPAKALEGAVPDLAARQIIDRQIGPAFRNGDYAGGLDAGVEALMARIRGEGLAPPDPNASKAETGLHIEELLLFFFIAVPVIGSVLTGIFGRKLGSLLTAGASGGIGWLISASLLIALGAGAVALFVVGLLGVGSGGGRGGGGGLGGLNRGRDLPHIGGWGGGRGGGGFGGGGRGGGFSSGGGGSFGGGGASGGW